MKKKKLNLLKLLLVVSMLLVQTNVASYIAYATTDESTDFTLVSEADETKLDLGEAEPEEKISADPEEEMATDSEEETATEPEEEVATEPEEENITETEEEIALESDADVTASLLRSLNSLRLVIDPGHGGRDPGAVAMHNGVLVTESEVVLDVSLRLQRLLNQTGMDISMTRDTDVYIPLTDRSNFANQRGADLFVSVHANSATNTSATGIETFYFGSGRALRSGDERINSSQHHGMNTSGIKPATMSREQDSRLLAEKIQARLVEKLQLTNRGVKQGNFSVIRETNMAAVLAELGFMSNQGDRTLLMSNAGRDLAAEGLYLGILDYLVAQGYNVPGHLFNLDNNDTGSSHVRQGQTTANLNVRTGNATSHSIITTLPKGTIVTILGEQNGWYRIESGNIMGWVSSEFVDIISNTNSPISYQTHIQDIGWQGWRSNGQLSGTAGLARRLEAIEIGLNSNFNGDIQYRTHIQDRGWQDWKSNRQTSGTIGESLRLEAIEVRLTGEIATKYDVYYRLHTQHFGWLDWAKNGERSGTAGFGFRAEAIEIVLVEKGGRAPGNTTTPYREQSASIAYATHVQDIGWQSSVQNGELSGTTGIEKRLEGITINISGENGGIRYRTHVQDIGWQNWTANGALSGTTGNGQRLAAIQIELTGEIKNQYHVYYRVHVQDVGWQNWVRNGEEAGTTGASRRLEAIEIRLEKK